MSAAAWRTLLALLLAANVLFFAWTHGAFDGVRRLSHDRDREPERLARQLRPETVRLLKAASAPPASMPDVAQSPAFVPACLQAGPFSDDEAPAVEQALDLAGVPRGRWITVAGDPRAAAEWHIAMGPYGDAATLSRKAEELRRLRIAFEQSGDGAATALLLGRFEQRDAADRALGRLAARGVHTARVVEAPAAPATFAARVERADAPTVARLVPLRLGPASLGFAPCGPGGASSAAAAHEPSADPPAPAAATQ